MLASFDKRLCVRRDSTIEDHVRQRQRTRKALRGKELLRPNTTRRSPRVICAALDDDLASIGEPNAPNLRKVGEAE
jgi:hypothetical protein